MSGFWKKLFGGGGGGKTAPAGDPVAYNGYVIHPHPKGDAGTFNIAGRIVRADEPDAGGHDFIRADTYTSLDDAVRFSVIKAKQIIDERGERLIPKKDGGGW